MESYKLNYAPKFGRIAHANLTSPERSHPRDTFSKRLGSCVLSGTEVEREQDPRGFGRRRGVREQLLQIFLRAEKGGLSCTCKVLDVLLLLCYFL
jgi:hypothetical protein